MGILTAVYLACRSEVIKLARAINETAVEAWGDTKMPIMVVAKSETDGVKLSRRYVWR